jgi:hypothetical protein
MKNSASTSSEVSCKSSHNTWNTHIISILKQKSYGTFTLYLSNWLKFKCVYIYYMTKSVQLRNREIVIEHSK